jgi:GH25 family lysozyme M1 (1,4-beta-N-acetylmuramidase)
MSSTGIDVSQHQGQIDFRKVKATGIDWVICKTSEGEDFKDPTWSKARVDAIRKAGLKLGVYHFLRPKAGRTGAVEARHAVATARAAGWGKPGDLRLAADIEVTDLNFGGPTHEYLEQFVKEVKRLTGQLPMIYTFPNFWQTQMKNRGNLGCPLWIAHFGVAHPTIPPAWQKFVIHQHSSTGHVDGVGGNVDLNRAAGALPLVAKPEPPKPPKPPVPKPKPELKPKPAGEIDKKEFQRTINRFVAKWVDDVPPLIVDGDFGAMTHRYIKQVQFWLGYGKRDGKPSETLVRRMRHPRNPRFTPPGMILRGIARRTKQKRHAKKEREAAQRKGVIVFDGKPCPTWIATILRQARVKGWNGVVVSGVRTTAHSIELCHQMCGAPSCPGKCAGASSNHNADEPVEDGEGAVDCSDFINLANVLQRMGAPLKNDLPRDLVHFSRSGH